MSKFEGFACLRCGSILPEEHRDRGYCDEHMPKLFIHEYPKCEHTWDKEVKSDKWSSLQCSKCHVLAIDEDMGG